MTIPLGSAAYDKTVANLFDNEKLSKTITSDDLKYNYVDVAYQSFTENYQAVGLSSRKLKAIPNAFYNGILKTIYHIANVILVKNYVNNKECLRAMAFYVLRDLTSSVGWIVTLFNDKFGQYLVQKSEFHISCYDFSIKYKLCKLLSEIHYVKKLEEIDSLPWYQKLEALVNFTKGLSIIVMKILDSSSEEILRRLFHDNALKDEPLAFGRLMFLLSARWHLSQGDYKSALGAISRNCHNEDNPYFENVLFRSKIFSELCDKKLLKEAFSLFSKSESQSESDADININFEKEASLCKQIIAEMPDSPCIDYDEDEISFYIQIIKYFVFCKSMQNFDKNELINHLYI